MSKKKRDYRTTSDLCKEIERDFVPRAEYRIVLETASRLAAENARLEREAAHRVVTPVPEPVLDLMNAALHNLLVGHDIYCTSVPGEPLCHQASLAVRMALVSVGWRFVRDEDIPT